MRLVRDRFESCRLVGSDLRAWHRLWTDYGQSGIARRSWLTTYLGLACNFWFGSSFSCMAASALLKLDLEAGFEPAPCRSRAGRSTTELLQAKIQSLDLFRTCSETTKIKTV